MKRLLVLGATSDIAKAVAKRFAAEKTDLILACRNPEDIQPFAQDLSIRSEINVITVPFDALDFTSHRAFYDSLPDHPDATICVFGYLGDQRTAETDLEETLRIINTNYTGAVSILNIVSEDYSKRGTGNIIGVSSVAGERGRQSNYIYGSAKSGFTAYLSGLRHRLIGKGVKVISVKPGFVSTKMTENLKLPFLLTATPEKVAEDIFKAYKTGKKEIYSIFLWRYIMMIIKLLPESIFLKTSL